MHSIQRKDVKTAAKFVVGMSVSFVVSNVLKNNTSEPEKTYQKVEIMVGSGVLAYMVADKAEAWTSKKVDEIADSIAKAKADSSDKK